MPIVITLLIIVIGLATMPPIENVVIAIAIFWTGVIAGRYKNKA